MVDEFILKPRKQYAKSYIYLYNQEGEFIGKYLGKEIDEEGRTRGEFSS